MGIQFTITDTRNPGERFSRTFVQDKVTIGRARYCDICLPDLSVSTCHAEVRLQDNDFWLVDNASLNGTFVDERKLVSHRPKKLTDGLLFVVASFEIRFQLGASLVAMTDRNLAQRHALKMLGSVLSMTTVPVVPTLEIVSGPGKSTRFDLGPAPSVAIIGRAMDADIHLDDPDVSRKHAEIIHMDGKVTIKDLGSRSGILYKEGRRRSLELTVDMIFMLGKTSLSLAHPLDPSLYHIQNAPEDETASFCTNISLAGNKQLPREVTAESSTRNEMERSGFETASNVAANGQAEMLNDADPVSDLKKAPDEEAIVEDSADLNGNDKDPNPFNLPTGPADPLIGDGGNDNSESQRELEPPAERKSDLGLIVVGAIVVVSCVLALIRLLA